MIDDVSAQSISRAVPHPAPPVGRNTPSSIVVCSSCTILTFASYEIITGSGVIQGTDTAVNCSWAQQTMGTKQLHKNIL